LLLKSFDAIEGRVIENKKKQYKGQGSSLKSLNTDALKLKNPNPTKDMHYLNVHIRTLKHHIRI
jgi:hypothetical protein